MKLLSILLFSTLLIGAVACGDENKPLKKDTLHKDSAVAQPQTGYDSVLAAETGADEYGMKKYVMAFLRKGPNREKDSLKRSELQRAHLDNIGRMAKEGMLVVAGPFLDDSDIRGIYIFNVTTIEEAQKLTETDPLIQSGGLVMELKPWYGSAALMKITELHERVAKKGI